jgi:hypothetical protein
VTWTDAKEKGKEKKLLWKFVNLIFVWMLLLMYTHQVSTLVEGMKETKTAKPSQPF